MDSKAFTVDIRTFYGGRFLFQKGKTEYVADGLFSDNHKYGLHLQCGVWSHKLTLSFLRSLAESLVESKEFELWYKKHGKNLTAGKTMMVSDLDIVNLLKTKDAANFVTVYVIQPVLNMKIANPRILHVKPLNSIPPPTIPPPRIGSPTPRTKTPNVVGSPSQQKSIIDGPTKSLMEKKPNLKAQKIVNAQHDESEFHPLPYSACFQSSWDPNPTLNAQQPKDSHVTSPLSLRRSPRFSSKVSNSNPTTSTAPIPKSSTKGPLLEKAVILSPITCITTPHFQTNSFRPKLATKKKLQFVEGDTSTSENVGKGSDTTTLEKVVADKAAEKAAEKTSKRASKKIIKTGIDDSKLCRCATATPQLYEVDYKGDTSIVNLTERSCTCFQWNLTGVPCVHAIGCMLELRINPEDYVDEYYSKAKYISAYAPPINPLPGAKH